MSVLRQDLPPKKEFVITIPLTDLQRKAYSIYVKSMLSTNVDRTKDGEIYQSTVWGWLAVLSLLCNHPNPFMIKLRERESQANGASTPVSREGTTDQENVAINLNPSASVWTVGVSESLVYEEQKLFTEQADNIKSVDLSYKTKLLGQILDASKSAGDKVLVFSQSIPTLDFLEDMCMRQGRKYARLDGKTVMGKRQTLTKQFNTGDLELYLISTTAGGLGLNLYGANRVIIFDFKFNPILEEQAVGRAYRIGQQKEVFVYRFVAGGTFEDLVHNKAIFKKQLASRVVDKKNPVRWAQKKSSDFLFEPKDVEQQDLSEFTGVDPAVLDKILASQQETKTIRAIVQTDTFEKDDDDNLTVEEMRQVKLMLEDEKLKRTNPQAYQTLMAQRDREAIGHHPTLGIIEPHPSFSASVRNQGALKAYSQAVQRPVRGPIRPPPRPEYMESRAGSTTKTPTAGPHQISLASPERTLLGPSKFVQTTSLEPASGASLPTSPGPTMSRLPSTTQSRPINGLRHGSPPDHQRGGSPIMGASTKKDLENSESPSLETSKSDAMKPSVEAAIDSLKNVNRHADQQFFYHSETLKDRDQDMDKNKVSSEQKVCIPSTPSCELSPAKGKSRQRSGKVQAELNEPGIDKHKCLLLVDSHPAQRPESSGRRVDATHHGGVSNAVVDSFISEVAASEVE